MKFLSTNLVKIFDLWNGTKKKIEKKNGRVFFHEKEVWYCKLGKNLGDEEDGKGEDFLRPVVILKKLNRNLFISVPLTSNLKKVYFLS